MAAVSVRAVELTQRAAGVVEYRRAGEFFATMCIDDVRILIGASPLSGPLPPIQDDGKDVMVM